MEDNGLTYEQLEAFNLAYHQQEQQRVHQQQQQSHYSHLPPCTNPTPLAQQELLRLDLINHLNAASNTSTSHPSSSLYAPLDIPGANNNAGYGSNAPFDNNSFGAFSFDDNYSVGTPSYAGSYTSSYGGFGATDYSNPTSASTGAGGPPPPPAGSTGTTPFDYLATFRAQQQAAGEPQLKFSNPTLSADVNTFLDYRLGRGGAGGGAGSVNGDNSDAESAYGGGGGAHSISGAASDAGGSVAGDAFVGFDFDPNLNDDDFGARSESPYPDAYLSSSSAAGAGAHGASPSSVSPSPGPQPPPNALSPFVFSFSDSPPSSTGEGVQRTSPPALAPLAIPSDNGPSISLTQATPHTARPRNNGGKGAGTLELERILGMTDWDVKSTEQEDYHSQPTARPTSQPRMMFTHQPATTPPEAYDSDQHPASTSTAAVDPPYPTNYLQTLNPRGGAPTRQRSKSESNVLPPPFPPPPPANAATPSSQDQHDSTNNTVFPTFPTSYLSHTTASTPTQTQFPWPVPNAPTVDSYHRPPSVASSAASDHSFEGQQHELTSRSRSSLSHSRRPVVGPGYHEAGGMFGADSSSSSSFGGGEGHRRARSQGHGHVRNVRSEDLSSSTASYGGAGFAPSTSASSSFFAHQAPPPPPEFEHSPYMFLAPEEGIYAASNSSTTMQTVSLGALGGGPSPPPVDPNVFHHQQQQQQHRLVNSPPSFPLHQQHVGAHVGGGTQRTPYVYHSPSPRTGSMDSNSSAGGSGIVSKESKTTQATIEAAMKRRNPGTQAKFVCDLCGETFTRRYNLKGHQRAHRNEKPYACSFEGCGKAFARAHDCKRHEMLHLNTRKYSCEPCERNFVRLDALQRHHRSEAGQHCVEVLRSQGWILPYDTNTNDNVAL